jgi:hypothetical protein
MFKTPIILKAFIIRIKGDRVVASFIYFKFIKVAAVYI